MSTSTSKLLRFTALGAAALIGTMLVIGFATGMAQEALQWIRPAGEYTAYLAAKPQTFRLVVGLDNAFIACYAAHFVLLHGWVVREGAPRGLAAVALGGILLTAGLDLLENMHFLVMSRQVQGGFGLSEAAAHAQVMASWLKFHVSYVGLLAFGLVFPRHTAVQRVVAGSLIWLQLPIGIAIYVVDAPIARALVLVRGGFFLVGLLLNAHMFRGMMREDVARVRVG